MPLPNLQDTTIELSPEEMKEYLINQTINHGLEVENLKKEISDLKRELTSAYYTLIPFIDFERRGWYRSRIGELKHK